MKNCRILSVFALLTPLALFTGCVSSKPEAQVTNPKQPGPAIGTAVGTAVGAVGSNVVGGVVAGVQGAADATKKTFTNEHRIIRTWKTETTSDGRTIQVPVEIEVDEYGRPIAPNPAPAPAPAPAQAPTP